MEDNRVCNHRDMTERLDPGELFESIGREPVPQT
jgi:hypothetical protein